MSHLEHLLWTALPALGVLGLVGAVVLVAVRFKGAPDVPEDLPVPFGGVCIEGAQSAYGGVRKVIPGMRQRVAQLGSVPNAWCND